MATDDRVRDRCEKQLRAHIVNRMDDELVEVLKALGTFDEIVRKTIAVIEMKSEHKDGVLNIDKWVDK